MPPEPHPATRPNPWSPEQKLRELTIAVRTQPIVDRIWQNAFTAEERQRISADETMGPDIIDIWSKFKRVSFRQAVIELALEADLISAQESQRLLRAIGEEVKLPVSTTKPEWDRKSGQLRLGGIVIKRVRRRTVASNVILILDSFQEAKWPRRQDNPLPVRKDRRQSHTARLQEAIKSLNRNLKLIRFGGDGTGLGIVWERL